MLWQPIDTAPKNGTPVLTDCGICLYVKPELWGSPMDKGWHDCDYGGHIYECADNGPYQSDPNFWMPLPEIPVG
jgi:hypothetical protein